MDHSTGFIQLLVTEAVRDVKKKYENSLERSGPISQYLSDLGKKPGFAITGLICKHGFDFDSVEDPGKFIATKLCPILFGAQVTASSNCVNKNIIITVSKINQTPWFSIFNSTMNSEQQFWLDCYASFFQGVFTGAITHMGYKSSPSYEYLPNGQLIFKFPIEELSQTWEFSAMN